MNALDQAIDKVGTPGKLAELLNVKPQVVSNWRERGIPTDMALDIERVTDGRVTAEQILAERRQRKQRKAEQRA